MRQALHLLIIREGAGVALAAHYASRWLLPILTSREHVRADPKVLRWAANRNVECDVVGQWLGRVQPEMTDWLMVMQATDGGRPTDRQLSWTPLETLASGPALIEYQRWALLKAIERAPLPALAGPFGTCEWPSKVKEWIRVVAGELACQRIRQFRSSQFEVVLSARTPTGDVYFKGLPADHGREPGITQALAAVFPEHFARTLAVETRADGAVWWLTAACPGVPVADAEPVARVLASVQRDLMMSPDVRRLLPALDLRSARRWAIELLDQAECTSRVDAHLHAVLDPRVPRGWIPMDLHPSNVLVQHDGTVRFIDLDESFFGPAPLALALFATRTRQISLRATYEQSWSPPLRHVDWTAFEAIAVLVDAWLGWQRIIRKTRLGEIHDALDIARERMRQRLLSCLSQRR